MRVGLDEGENYVLLPNDRPVPVLPEKDERLVLGSEELGEHLFAITWKEESIWFNLAHSICGGFGALSWIKTTLYQYLTKKYGEIKAPADLKARIKYARKHSIYLSDARDTYMISYVGKTDWGGMAEYIRSVYPITDGNLVLEVIALPEKFCISFEMLTKDRKPLDLFCDILREEQLPFTVSDRMVRYMPDLQLPEPES